MTSSDLIDSHQASEGMSTQTGTSEAESAPGNSHHGESVHGETAHGETAPEKRVSLPKPDTNNITVLTESLPNEPILPWHHFDSPWLDKEEPAAEEIPTEEVVSSTDDDSGEQLSLALDEVSDSETRLDQDESQTDSLNDQSMY